MSIGNYKVGDEVRIKSNLKIGEEYSVWLFIDIMDKYKSKEAKITEIDHKYGNYRLNIDDGRFRYTDEMLEPAIEQPKYVKCIDDKDAESKLEIGKIYKIKEIRNKYHLSGEDGYKLVGDEFDGSCFYQSRFVPVSSLQQKSQSTKSIIKIRQVGDTTYATYNTHGKGQATRNPDLDEYNKEYGILLATAKALGLNKDKVDKIIDVLF